MTIATFDTLEFVESLESSGFTKEQSKGMVNAFKKAQETQLKELATKGDLKELEAKIEKELAPIRADLLLIKWMLALVITSTVLPALKTLFG
ncbi:MAG: CCDC90 family protein [Magnetococcus sp. YQC-5]